MKMKTYYDIMTVVFGNLAFASLVTFALNSSISALFIVVAIVSGILAKGAAELSQKEED